MPTYSTACSCGRKDIIYRSIAERDNLLPCACGEMPRRVIDKPMIQAEINPYVSPYDGRTVYSRAERRRDLQEAKAYEWEPGIEKDIARRQEYAKEEAFRPISAAVDDIVRDLNVCGKLENLNA
jgi:hypothetical protein